MDSEARYFSDFIEMDDSVREFMVMSFSSQTLDINDHWENSTLSAKFLSSLWGKFFPVSEKGHKSNRTVVQDSVRFIAAELLGNAVKFGFGKQFDIRVNLHMEKNELRFYVTNSVNPLHIDEYQTFIQRLLTEDLDEMYITQMERNSEEGNTESRMGYLTIILDYEGKMSWKFERRESMDIVTTLVRLPIIRQ